MMDDKVMNSSFQFSKFQVLQFIGIVDGSIINTSYIINSSKDKVSTNKDEDRNENDINKNDVWNVENKDIENISLEAFLNQTIPYVSFPVFPMLIEDPFRVSKTLTCILIQNSNFENHDKKKIKTNFPLKNQDKNQSHENNNSKKSDLEANHSQQINQLLNLIGILLPKYKDIHQDFYSPVALEHLKCPSLITQVPIRFCPTPEYKVQELRFNLKIESCFNSLDIISEICKLCDSFEPKLTCVSFRENHELNEIKSESSYENSYESSYKTKSGTEYDVLENLHQTKCNKDNETKTYKYFEILCRVALSPSSKQGSEGVSRLCLEQHIVAFGYVASNVIRSYNKSILDFMIES